MSQPSLSYTDGPAITSPSASDFRNKEMVSSPRYENQYFVKVYIGNIYGDLSDGAFRLLARLKELAWQTGVIEMTLEDLASLMDRSAKTVSRHLSELEKKRHVFRRRRGLGLSDQIVVVESCWEIEEKSSRDRASLEAARRRSKSNQSSRERTSRVDIDGVPEQTKMSDQFMRTDAYRFTNTEGAPTVTESEVVVSAVAEQLVMRGVYRQTAVGLVAAHGVDVCQRALGLLLRERDVKSPARWLHAAITRDCWGLAPRKKDPTEKEPLEGSTPPDETPEERDTGLRITWWECGTLPPARRREVEPDGKQVVSFPAGRPVGDVGSAVSSGDLHMPPDDEASVGERAFEGHDPRGWGEEEKPGHVRSIIADALRRGMA